MKEINPKSEILNPKKLQISKPQCFKQYIFGIWKIRISDLFRISKFEFRILFLLLIFFLFPSSSFASEKITILISGQSHASLYPCDCPKDPNGGVARRSALIKQIRNTEKNVLLLEAGGSFAGGNYDDHSQTTDLDKQRTDFYLQSLVKMDYDAFLVSSEEFNFGEDFLKEEMSKYKLNFLSANLKGDFKPYIVKEIAGIKIAVIGITDNNVKSKTQLEYADSKESLKNTIREIKKNTKANAIIVLSYLDEKQSKEIIDQMEGIDILIASNNPFRPASSEKIKNTVLIMPAWQARALTKIGLTYDSKNPSVINIDQVNLNKDLKDDPEIASIIPACFTDRECKKPGFSGKCDNGASIKAQCVYSEIKPVEITIIQPKSCKTCSVEAAIEKIKKIIPNLKINYLLEDSKQAKELIDKLKIKMLPAYLINQSIEKETAISGINQIARKQDKYYVLEPGFTGVSYFVNRKKIANRLDVFFDISTKDIVKLLEIIQGLRSKRQDIDIHLNFLAIEDSNSGFVAKNGKYEIEEFLRGACINKYYPDKIWQYLSCRYSDVETSWWDDCIFKLGMDPSRIKVCAQSEEGKISLRELIKLTQELEVVFGPTFVINNQEVFSSEGTPTVEELEALFK